MHTITSSLRRALLGGLGFAALAMAAPSGALAQETAEAQTECFVMFATYQEMSDIIEDLGFDPESYDALCARLQADGLALKIDGEVAHLGDQVVSWASIRLMRMDSEIVSTSAATNTRIVTPEIPIEEALPLMQMAAVNAAMEALYNGFDNHLGGLQEEEARLAAFFAQQGS